jgi:hypothetical protein
MLYIRLHLILIFVALSAAPGFCYDIPSPLRPFPKDLLYQGKSIPEDLLEEFFVKILVGMGQPTLELDLAKSVAAHQRKILWGPLHNLEIIFFDKDQIETYQTHSLFEWQYIGPIHKDFHVVRAYSWEEGCWGKFTGLLILKREGDRLKIIDIVDGSDRHSSQIFENGCVIKGDRILYRKGATTGYLIDAGLIHYLKQVYDFEDDAILQGCHGEAGYCGELEKSAEIGPDGSVKTIDIIKFTPCEDYQS